MGVFYFLRDNSNSLVKIGCTSAGDVEARLNALRTGNPGLQLALRIETADPFGVETLLHRSFAPKRKMREFFELTRGDLEEAERIARFADEAVPIRESVDLLKQERDNGILIEPLEAHQQLVDRLREVKHEYDRIKLEKDELELQLKSIIGLFAGIDGLVTWKALEQPRLDQTQLKLERPEIYQEYTRIRTMRKLLLIR